MIMERQHSVLQASLITIALISAGLLLIFTKLKARKRLPPGPTPWPVVGNLPLLGPLPHQDLQKLAKEYGPLMSMRLGSKNFVIVSSPKYAEEFLKANDRVWASRPKTSHGIYLCNNCTDVSMSPYGPRWRYARKVFVTELVTARRIAGSQISRRKEILSAVKAILKQCDGGKAVRMDMVLSKMTMSIVSKLVMNQGSLSDRATATKDDDEFRQTVKETFELSGVFNIGDYIPWLDRFDLQGYNKRMRAVAEKLNAFLQGIIDDHREMHKLMQQQTGADKASYVPDMVDIMLTRPSEADGRNLTDTEMRGMMEDVMFGGTDTSANTIEWCLSELIKNPRVLRKAQEEIDSTVGGKRLVEESDLPNLPYLQAVVKETLRLHTVAPLMIPHESTEASTVGGYEFPAKSRLFVNIYAIHRDPDVWERPLEFYPERFLDHDRDVGGADFELLPFGSGRRMCPGKNLAMITVPSAVAALIHAFEWRLPEGQKPEDLDMCENFGVTVPRKNPLKAVAVPRLASHVIVSEPTN